MVIASPLEPELVARIRAVDDRRLRVIHLWAMANVLLSPHQASITDTENPLIVELFVDNLERYLAGRPLRNVYDRDREY